MWLALIERAPNYFRTVQYHRGSSKSTLILVNFLENESLRIEFCWIRTLLIQKRCRLFAALRRMPRASSDALKPHTHTNRTADGELNLGSILMNNESEREKNHFQTTKTDPARFQFPVRHQVLQQVPRISKLRFLQTNLQRPVFLFLARKSMWKTVKHFVTIKGPTAASSSAPIKSQVQHSNLTLDLVC